MIDHPIVDKLHQEFIKETGVQISDDHFDTVLTFFPALSIVACDGEVDDDEWFYVENLALFMARTYRDQMESSQDIQKLSEHFENTMKLILERIIFWEPRFLHALSEYLTTDPSYKSMIYEILEMFAESSEGISEDEEKKLMEINEILGLLNDE